MKIINKYCFFVLAALSVVACNDSDLGGGEVSPDSNLSIRVQLAQSHTTKSISPATHDGIPVAVNTSNVTINALYELDGDVIQSYVGTYFNKGTTTDTYTEYNTSMLLNSSTKAVEVQFNPDGQANTYKQLTGQSVVVTLDPGTYGEITDIQNTYSEVSRPLTNNVNTRQGGLDENIVLASGSAEVVVNPTNPEMGTADVTATAEMARIEILDDIYYFTLTRAEPIRYPNIVNYRNLKIEAVYLNRTALVRGGEKDITVTGKQTWADDFKVDGKKYGLYSNLAGLNYSVILPPGYGTPNINEITECVITNDDGYVTFGFEVEPSNPNKTEYAKDINHTNFFSRSVYERYYTEPGSPTKEHSYASEEIPPGAESVGFNIFPQGKTTSTIEEARNEQPHLIIKYSYSHKAVTTAGDASTWTWATADQINYGVEDNGDDSDNYSYMNIVAFKDELGSFPAFEAGKVYQLSMRDILELLIEKTTPFDPDEPDSDKSILDLTVYVRNWSAVDVDPETGAPQEDDKPIDLPTDIPTWEDGIIILE